MRAVVQRVSRAEVSVESEGYDSKIGRGLLVFLGVGEEDGEEDCRYMAGKIAGLRIFEDAHGKMNLSSTDVDGEILLISQFTLYGDCRKGRRPSFVKAAPPEKAEELYEVVAQLIREKNLTVKTGIFRTHMEVEIHNDGPVTMLIDSRKGF